ncbi:MULTISPECIES: RNA polymerase sigma factor [Methylomonas]|uniref:RNA polymerase subunit sigma-24 n=2 Tax=Methylomonas TaxID=416 RepID=A0A126T3S9_9GAMM|nr:MULTISPECIES: RNA polymerase sigma factor [Methylomonas]AMK76718.1 RNA polymerase subunit sigma-24 [Methylomonas denitrificans]OAI00037.1 RNA polymerase subunit sigma-24 [Methylomonas methanica]TCV82789.1 RNA polymerase sigma-70 factor (ECF subfamily) [Methylomonas methanica]
MAFSDHDIYRIFLSTRPQIQRFLQQRIRCQDTAADLIQDIFLRLSLLKPPPATEVEVRAWLFTVASNLSLDHLRTQKRRCELLDQYLGDASEIDDSAAPERVAQAQDQLQQIQAALADLPDQCAEILYLSRIEGLSHVQIAKQLKISTSWVEKQLAKALLHCRLAVDDEGA